MIIQGEEGFGYVCGAEVEYSAQDIQQARAYFDKLSPEQSEKLVNTLIARLPGAEEHYTLEDFRSLAAYLRRN